MKHASYLQRVSRHLGTTAVLVPSRRFWNARSERVPIIAEEVTIATPARATVRTAQPVRTEPVPAHPPPEEEPAHEQATADAVHEMPPEARSTAIRTAPPESQDEESASAQTATTSSALARLSAVSATLAPNVTRTRAAMERRDTAAAVATAAAAARSFVAGGEPAGGGDHTVTAPLAPHVRATRRAGEPLERAVVPPRGNRAPQARTSRAAGEPTASPAAEPSVQIGAIEVHVQPPPRPAVPSTPSGPLARGFASTFGLRQE